MINQSKPQSSFLCLAYTRQLVSRDAGDLALSCFFVQLALIRRDDNIKFFVQNDYELRLSNDSMSFVYLPFVLLSVYLVCLVQDDVNAIWLRLIS